MALITIWVEDGPDGHVRVESDPPLTKLKINAKEWKEMTPAVSYAMIGIAAMLNRARKLNQEGNGIIH